ncbi:MAG TPA: DNA mismatch repair protein MutS [Candidatus Dojkabacteria bacterium]|nr:DNA mismatch repair protein MutS [Candidatus Dojkabacteria bacterium]
MKSTPMMQQYNTFKNQYPDKLLLYRMGDFFETFGEDAKTTSKILNITLTSRDKNSDPTPLAGFPHHALDQYLPKLINAGLSVVIVDQVEDPKLAKGIVKRAVTRIVTPGTIDNNENSPKNTYILSIAISKKNTGITLCDIQTGKLLITQFENRRKDFLVKIINSFEPVEVLLLQENTLIPGDQNDIDSKSPISKLFSENVPIQPIDTTSYKNSENFTDTIKKQFKIKNLEAMGLDSYKEANTALAMIIDYVLETQKISPEHINKIEKININGSMVLDSATIRNLEIVSNSVANSSVNSLFSVLNQCQTQMGKRLLYNMVLNPLLDAKEINDRLDRVTKYVSSYELLMETRNILSEISDIERLAGKIGLNRANARDYLALANTIEKALLIEESKKTAEELNELKNAISETFVDNPPNTITEGHIIRDEISSEVKELRELSGNSKTWVKDFIVNERQKTGISTLKIGFNKVFGYYIEASRSLKNNIPDYYERKQTLVNCERYVTEELKHKEEIILGAEEKLAKIEFEIFQSFRTNSLKYLPAIIELGNQLAQIDVYSNLAYIANLKNYTRPDIYDIGENNGKIEIVDGRHPVVEDITEDQFIPNDTLLDLNNNRVAILTGPNMSGKSTYIRQVALLVLMAQIGSYIPARKASISIVDRIFTRVGAHDDLNRGRSTFMVEMEEASNIVNNATKNSLIILDEIGRGTSTYDGVSIAWSLAEYLANDIGARTLFATHYHELLKLGDKFPDTIKNYNVKVEENDDTDEVIFLRKIISGGTDRSYGIYVAKMAGIPNKIINRAKEILMGFEQESMFGVKNQDIAGSHINGGNGNGEDNKNGNGSNQKNGKSKIDNNQLIDTQYPYSLFESIGSGIIGEIGSLKIDEMTPMEALKRIAEWKKRVG